MRHKGHVPIIKKNVPYNEIDLFFEEAAPEDNTFYIEVVSKRA